MIRGLCLKHRPGSEMPLKFGSCTSSREVVSHGTGVSGRFWFVIAFLTFSATISAYGYAADRTEVGAGVGMNTMLPGAKRWIWVRSMLPAFTGVTVIEFAALAVI